MSQATLQKPQLDQVLDLVDALDLEQQEMLVDIVRSRLRECRRDQILADVAEAEEEYRRGNYRTGTVEELLAELDAELGR